LRDHNHFARRISHALRLFTLAALFVLGAGIWSGVKAGTQVSFPCPPVIEPNVHFWVDVFTLYSYRDFVIHDRDQVSRVYQVMHLPGSGPPGRDEAESIRAHLTQKYTNILNDLATGAPPSTYEERGVAKLFQGEPASAYALAAQNLRVQEGMREQFREGLLRSRYYWPSMERTFRMFGLPPELVTLADVESGFYSRAKSGAGAVGIWQFTRATGREYMRITRYHDDRLNPTTETEAAARLLRYNYDALGSWPLAITAYNYGTGGTEQASAEFGGDYSKIVRAYNGPHFGFASKNYYPEFLAALEVHQNEDKYFPDMKYAETPTPPPVKTDFAPKRTVRRSAHHRRTHKTRHTHRQVT
jgi:membrane-bound lytic murein transglycosylase D